MKNKKGDSRYYVDENGKIHRVVVMEDESEGYVQIRFADGKKKEISAFHVFVTKMAANMAALSRSEK